MMRRPPRSTHCISSAASDVYKRQYQRRVHGAEYMGQSTWAYEIAGKMHLARQCLLFSKWMCLYCIQNQEDEFFKIQNQLTEQVELMVNPLYQLVCLLYTSPSPRDQA
eukprot:TRINITY_DN37023_c0_g1_i1.p3 TRINITY_DN37023_c0_g1~~TRINITY_DN37023_c0_g1_i1.p3  ORF type:complete len:108 (-),score=35.40 TRINITY_DN37023_c0_g1_i1:85-408(-)